MDTVIKAAAAGAVAALLAALLKRSNPELSLCLMMCACAAVLLGALGAFGDALDVFERVAEIRRGFGRGAQAGHKVRRNWHCGAHGRGYLPRRRQRFARLGGGDGRRRRGAVRIPAAHLNAARDAGGADMKRLIILFAVIIALTAPALADDAFPELADALGADELAEALPEEANDVLGDGGVEQALDTEGLIGRLWKNVKEKASEVWRSALGSALSMVAVCLLCGLAAVFTEGAADWVSLGGVLAIAAIALTGSGAYISAASEAIQTLSDFSRALLPCLTAAATVGGAVTSAAAKYAATSLFMDIFITAAGSVIFPLLWLCLAAYIASAAMRSPALESAAKLIKWICSSVTALIMTAFTLYLTVSGAVTGSSDAVTAKAAKTVISAALPVVGSIISDAAATVTAGAGLLKAAIGVFGLAAVACVCVTPFLTLGVRYLLYKAAAALSGAFADSRLASLIGSIGGVFGVALGVVGAAAIMLFLSIVSVMKVVTG